MDEYYIEELEDTTSKISITFQHKCLITRPSDIGHTHHIRDGGGLVLAKVGGKQPKRDMWLEKLG